MQAQLCGFELGFPHLAGSYSVSRRILVKKMETTGFIRCRRITREGQYRDNGKEL